MTSEPLNFDRDMTDAYDKAMRGDQRAGRFLLTLLHNSLRESGGATLTNTGREILADILREIIQGKDARDATFTRIGSGDPQWKRQGRDQLLVGAMGWRIKEGKTIRKAAIELADSGRFIGKHGEPLTWKTINNIYNKRKDDPDLNVVFFKDDKSFPTT